MGQAGPGAVPPADVIIVGGGIVGLSCAIALRERGRDVVLIDPGEERRRASFGNAGMINRASIFSMAGPGIRRNLWRYLRNVDPGLRLDLANLWRVLPWLRRFMRSSTATAWRASAAALDPLTAAAGPAHERLATLAGTRHLLDRSGWLRLFSSEQSFAFSLLEREILGLHDIPFEVIPGQAIAEMEPALIRPYSHGIMFPDMTLVRDPGALVTACEALFEGLGGRIIRAAATELQPDGEVWRARYAGGSVAGRQAVLAAGAWSGRLARALGYHFPLAAERGYHRHFRTGNRPLRRSIHDTAGGCVISPMQMGLRVLAGVQLAPRDAPPDHRLIDGAVAAAGRAIALGDSLEETPWMGSRPSTPDGLPVVGLAPRHTGLAFAFGHGHIGLSTGPVTGQIVADLLSGTASELPITAFRPRRLLV